MAVSLDVFNTDPFKTIQLTQAVEKVPFLPQGIGGLGIFEDDPIYVETAVVEERDGLLALIPFSERGTDGLQRTTELRKARAFKVPRLRHEDTVYARELANIREFGTESVLMQVMTEVARRFAGPAGLLRNIEYTWEYQRLAAIQGLLLDSDGSTLYNWFTEFGVTQPTEIAFNLSANVEGALRPLANSVVRGMARAAKGGFLQSTEIYAACGDDFWDAFTTHQDVTRTYYNWQAAQELRTGAAFDTKTFEPAQLSFQAMYFAGIYWFNYRGSDDASTIAIAHDKVKFFPRGAPGIFRRVLSPGESIDWVNTLGRPYYARIIPDVQRNEWAKPEVSSYPLHICTRPAVLYSGRQGT
jgi:hypothetical protein